MSANHRPLRRCSCGRRTRAASGVCGACQGLTMPKPNGLPPGRWVPTGRGILVYRGLDGLPIDREAS